MKFIIKIISVVCVLSLVMSASVVSAFGTPSEKTVEGTVLENSNYKLVFDDTECNFYVESKADGRRWYSHPDITDVDSLPEKTKSILSVSYTNTDSYENVVLDSYTECVAIRDSYTVSNSGDKLEIVFNFPDPGITVPMVLELADDGFKATVKMEEISVKLKEVCIINVKILPFFGAAAPDDDGYLFVPDGSGALIEFSDTYKDVEAYSEPVYGGDLADQAVSTLKNEKVLLPVFGVKKGSQGFLAIIENGAADCSIYANRNHQSTKYANVYAGVNVGKSVNFNLGFNKSITFEKMPVSNVNTTIYYRFLFDEASDYSGMALNYRDYLSSVQGFENKKTSEPTVYLDVYAGTVTKKSAFIFTYNGYTVLTSADELENMIETLKDNGIENICVRYLEANSQEVYSKIVNKTSFVSSLKFNSKKLQSLNSSSGVKVYPTISDVFSYTNENYIFSRKNKGIKNVANVTVRLGEEPDAFGNSEKMVTYIVKPDVLVKNLSKLKNSIKKSDIEVFGFSNLGNTLYSEYAKKTYKQSHIETLITEEIAGMADVASLCFDEPNLYAIKYAKDIVGAPVASSNYAVFDRDVPFWQIAVGKFVNYSGDLLNNEYTDFDVLKLIETGTYPRFNAIARNGKVPATSNLNKYYCTSLDAQLSDIVDVYKTVCEVHKLSKGSAISNHIELSEGVYKTCFENGAWVIVNYNDTEYVSDSGDNVLPHGYIGGDAI